MSEVFIPLGGAGGKNRGNSFYISDTAPTAEILGRIITPLPAGVYKKFVTPDGQVVFPSADGGDAVVSMSKEFLKKQAIKTFGIASITNFNLSMYAHRQVRLTWAKPSMGLWSGVHFVFKYDSMPADENDGFMVYDSADVHYETSKLEERELFVRAYSYVTVKDGRWYDEGKVSARITVTGISGSVTLSTGAGTWTVPDKVEKIRFIVVGQGGAGGHNGKQDYIGAGGGGGGRFASGYMDVTPGQAITYIIPNTPFGEKSVWLRSSADFQAYFNEAHLGALDTSFGNLNVQHGGPGYIKYYDLAEEIHIFGGSGGSGGGGGLGGVGGTDGSDGTSGGTYPRGWKGYRVIGDAGKGSRVSTRGFNGVLYSSGGAGGSAITGLWGRIGTDGLGEGGGGAGGSSVSLPGSRGGTGCIYIAWGDLMND